MNADFTRINPRLSASIGGLFIQVQLVMERLNGDPGLGFENSATFTITTQCALVFMHPCSLIL